MATIKPFKGLRPPKSIVQELSCLPYDVMSSQEAARMASDKSASLLHVTRAEINFDHEVDPHSTEVYRQAAQVFDRFIHNGLLVQDEESCFYVYAQNMQGHTQYGIVGAAAYEDYLRGIIKKHELTRPDKEDDRMILTRYLRANIEPVFFSYRAVEEIDQIVEQVIRSKPDYDFEAEDKVRHTFWVIRNPEINMQIEQLFDQKVESTYVADGHHRTAAAARIGQEFKSANPQHRGDEPYNYFMAVHFPDNQLQILDYNRTIKDLNGLTPKEFVDSISENFEILSTSQTPIRPSARHMFSMYIDGLWYELKAKSHTYDDKDPIKSLDVTILSKFVLENMLDIKDLRTDTRIDFVGGIRGLDTLSARVDSGSMRVAFALFPVSMDQLIRIADTDQIMPPKTTWFEPKLRSGLVIHKLD